VSPRRILIARVIAVAVDLAQYALLPTELTPLNNAVDVLTGIAMLSLVGWNWAFLPTFLAELVPFVDLVPSWTLAVMFATRQPATLPSASALRRPPLPPSGQARDASGS
jgi:hypothetical protein